MITGRLLFPCFLFTAAVAAAAPAVAPVDTVITSDRLDVQSTDTETTSDFMDKVVVTGTNMKLTCDRLIAVTTRVTDKTATIGTQNGFKSLLAIGHVHLTQNDGLREATCGQAEVFPKDDKIVLTHDPIVIDKANGSKATGDVIELYKGQRQVKGSHVQITFPPVKDLGFDKNSAPATPPSVPAAPSAGSPPADTPPPQPPKP